MTNKETLKKKIIYRSTHRGTKEMDIILGNFVKRHINEFSIAELTNLNELLSIEDEVLYQWYFSKNNVNKIPNNELTKKLKSFKL